ncbi:MAG: toxin-antitoxin system HicB family antitoxin [Acidobacteriota bacterium]
MLTSQPRPTSNSTKPAKIAQTDCGIRGELYALSPRNPGAYVEAKKQGKSLNQWITEKLRQAR